MIKSERAIIIKKILDETKNKVSIEASTTNNWDKYVGKYGKKFGINANFVPRKLKKTVESVIFTTKIIEYRSIID